MQCDEVLHRLRMGFDDLGRRRRAGRSQRPVCPPCAPVLTQRAAELFRVPAAFAFSGMPYERVSSSGTRPSGNGALRVASSRVDAPPCGGARGRFLPPSARALFRCVARPRRFIHFPGEGHVGVSRVWWLQKKKAARNITSGFVCE